MTTPRTPSRVTVAALAGSFLVAATLAGCSSSGGEDAGSSDLPPPLSPAWTQPDTPMSTDGELTAVHRVDDRLLYTASDLVTALDAETGEPAWRHRVHQGCQASDPNRAGDIVVVSGEGCRDVAVIDGDTGERRWRTHIPSVSGYDSSGVVASIGDRTVTLVQFCGQVTRLSLRDGHRLGVLAHQDRACANEADSDGQLIALWHDPETAKTPDGHGTGWIPSWNGQAAYELYDADTGKLLWSRRTDRSGGGLTDGAIVSSDPTILALQENGHTAMRTYRAGDPQPGRYVGRLDEGFEPLGIVDGVMVGSYDELYALGGGTRLFAYDLDTGEELWTREVPTAPAPTDGPITASGPIVRAVDSEGIVLTERVIDTDAPPKSSYQVWLTRWDLRTGEDAGALGWIAVDTVEPSWTAVDGVLVTTTGPAVAYELPEADPGLSVPGHGDVAWADDDVRPDPMADPCAAVRAETLRQLGLRRSATLPVPAECEWTELDDPEGSERRLEVTVSVSAPGEVPDATAVESAEAQLRTMRSDFYPEDFAASGYGLTLPRPRPVDGIGDEAYAASTTRYAEEFGTTSGSYLLVRVRNVVVEVRSAGGYDIPSQSSAPPSLARLEAATIAAARDVLAPFGLTLESPETDPGSRIDAGGVCGALRAEAAALGLPRSRPVMPPGSDPRAAECAWWQNVGGDGELHVHAYAADDSPLTGRSARQVAERIFYDSRQGGTEPLPDLGDQAWIDGFHFEQGNYVSDDYTVTVLVDNLVVQVSYSRNDGTDPDTVRQDAIRLARTAIGASVPSPNP